METKHWSDWVDTALGAWLIASPWVLQYPNDAWSASWNCWVLGAAILVLSFEEISLPDVLEEWYDMALGALLIISPWAWDYSSHLVATLNAVITGILVVGFSTWGMNQFMHLEERWRERHGHSS
jgi:hypothetical protein